MGGWTGRGKDRVKWNGVVSIDGEPVEAKDLTTKKYVDDEIALIPTATPAGSAGEIQFNEASAFQADSDLFWDNVNKRLGVGLNDPDEIMVLQTAAHTAYSLSSGGSAYDSVMKFTENQVEKMDMGYDGSASNFMIRDKRLGSGNPRLFVIKNTTKNVGIGGITEPSAAIHLQREEAFVKFDSTGTNKDSTLRHIIRSGNYWQQTHEGNSAGGVVGAQGDFGWLHKPSGGSETMIMSLTPAGNVDTAKIRLTVEGGYAIKLTNKTGSNSVKGQIVEVDSATDNSFETADLSCLDAIGVVYNAGVSDGSETWVVQGGIAEVLADSGDITRGDRIITSSADAGSAETANLPTAAQHFREMGHALTSALDGNLFKAAIHIL